MPVNSALGRWIARPRGKSHPALCSQFEVHLSYEALFQKTKKLIPFLSLFVIKVCITSVDNIRRKGGPAFTSYNVSLPQSPCCCHDNPYWYCQHWPSLLVLSLNLLLDGGVGLSAIWIICVSAYLQSHDRGALTRGFLVGLLDPTVLSLL